MHQTADHDPFASLCLGLFASPRNGLWSRERRSRAEAIARAVDAFAEHAFSFRFVVDVLFDADVVDVIDLVILDVVISAAAVIEWRGRLTARIVRLGDARPMRARRGMRRSRYVCRPLLRRPLLPPRLRLRRDHRSARLQHGL
jgi:hypothetical protein